MTRLRAEATAAGFAAVGCAAPDAIASAGERLYAFLDAGRHGDMTWMEETRARRASPRTLWPDAKSAICLAMNYGPREDPLEALQHSGRGVLSCYARGKDYHVIVKKALKRVARWIVSELSCEVKVFVDTAPLMEKPLAAAAGIGWQGKHTNLVSREFGSWLFLGVILTDVELATDPAERDHCGSCRRCLDVCPTDAFPAPYQLDARRCISYLTIEHRGAIPHEFRIAMGNRVFGCDDCLAVCPWNKFAITAAETRFHARAETDNPPLRELLALSEETFQARFKGTPVKRTGRAGLVRNAAIAAGNSGDASLVGALCHLLADPEAIVRGAAVWALGRLASCDQIAILEKHHQLTETDLGVQREWALVLKQCASEAS